MKTTRTVRLFLSSTFRDFGEERDLLVRKVFPALRARLNGFSKSAQDPHISSSGGMCDLKGSENKYLKNIKPVSKGSDSHRAGDCVNQRHFHNSQYLSANLDLK